MGPRVQAALCTGTALPPFRAEEAKPPEGKTPALDSDPQVRAPMKSGDAAGQATDNLQIADGMDVTPPGRSGVSLTQPSAALATPGATPFMPTGAEGGASAIRDRRSRPRGSGRGSRATNTGRGTSTSRERILRPGGSGPAPALRQSEGNGGEHKLSGKQERAREEVKH